MGWFAYRLPGASENEELLVRSQKLFLGLSAVAVAITAFSGGLTLTVVAIVASALGFLVQWAGLRLYEGDTSENWLFLSIGDTLKSIVGWVLIIAGWVILLRGVIVLSIWSILQ